MLILKRVLVALSLVLATGLVSAETILIHGEAGPNRGARAVALQWFADQVEERSAGELKIQIQWGGALFKANASVSSIHDGVADLGTVIAVYFPQEMAAYGVADLPLNNPDAWVGMKATDEVMRTDESIQADLSSKGLVYIGTFTTSQVNIGCKGSDIRSADDIKGLIDCSQGYSYAVTALKQAEVMSSYTLLDWGQVGGVGIFMNKDVHDLMSGEQQSLLADVGAEMSDEFGRLITAANIKAIEDMKAAGLEIITLPDGERAKLLDLGTKFVSGWVETATKSGLDGQAILTNYQALIEKYTQQRDEQGYPWLSK